MFMENGVTLILSDESSWRASSKRSLAISVH